MVVVLPPLSNSRPPESAKIVVPFAVHYLSQTAVIASLTQLEPVLGIVGFGAKPVDFPQLNLPYLKAPLVPFSGGTMFEVWTAAHPVRPGEAGRVTGHYNDAVAWGMITLPDDHGTELAAEQAYLEIFDFLEMAGHQTPIRFWNYLVAITGCDNGLERYRRFNIGRQRAFSARLKQALPPAASAVGGHSGTSVIYFLAAQQPALPVENPRQISAFDYPALYGPRSPSFSRASVYTQGAVSCMFVSGTASIVGHETRHVGDLLGQIRETAENLRAIIGQAEQVATTQPRGEWALKIYLHDPAAQQLVAPVIDAIFGASAARIYLRGDICRRELLIEIEAFRQFV